MRRFQFFAFFALICVAFTACDEPRSATPIAGARATAPEFLGASATPNAVMGQVPPHPFLASDGRAAMHADAYNSDVHPGPGPLGRAPKVRTRDGSQMPGGSCPVVTVARDRRLVVLCANLFHFELHLIDPQTLDLLARYLLPPRPSTFEALYTLDPDKIMSDTSGAYFYLDEQDRIVIPDARQHIRRIAYREVTNESGKPSHWEFYELNDWNLQEHVPHDCVGLWKWRTQGECDPITGVMPDYAGRIWWITRHGRLGTLNPDTGEIHAMQLTSEEIQNGLAVAEDGVYVLSDHALYRFEADASGAPQIGWREVYDRGSDRKQGSINQGSGTTPTLFGDNYITITDNADERIRLLVYRRRQDVTRERLVCAVPLFDANASATDNSMIAWARSIIIENNYGYSNVFQQKDWSRVRGGITRIDVREDESGCDVVWTSPERSPSVVPKLSAANGLVYFYTFESQPNGKNAWYLMALDFATGATRFKIRTGTGPAFDNNWSPITLAPDGTAYVGVLQGLVAIHDTE